MQTASSVAFFRSQKSFSPRRSWPLIASFLIFTFVPGNFTALAVEEKPMDLSSSALVKQANAPLSSIMQIRFRDTYISQFHHAPGQGNIFGVDITMPLPAYRLLPIRHLTLLSMPAVVTNPDGISGGGDLSFIDLAIVKERKQFLWGVGPVLVMPTASDRRFGQGKWQVGPAGGFAVTTERWMFGAIVKNPMSVGGDEDRRSINQMVLQPFVNYQLGRGWFIRSQPQFFFDWKTGQRTFPVDLGVGRVFKIGRQNINWYVQPFWNFPTGGGHPPRNGVTTGISFLFPEFWKKLQKAI